MHVVITGIAQGLSFETGQSFNYLTLLLPNGNRIKASVGAEALNELTALFVQGGGPAAQVAIANAAQEPQTSADDEPPVASEDFARMQRGQEAKPQDRPFPALDFPDGSDGDEEAVSTFGGDYQAGSDPELEAVGQQLQQAESRMAHAIGDTSSASPAELRQMVERIAFTEPASALPVPSAMTKAPAPIRRLVGPKVEADSMGNPVIKGAGLVDPHALAGGNIDGEEDVGQV